MSLTDKLHDEVDFREGLREKTTAIVKKVFDEEYMKAVDKHLNAKKAFEQIALLVENEISGITTEAVRGAYKLARQRHKNN